MPTTAKGLRTGGVLVLFSGGLESMALCQLAQSSEERAAAMWINYGQTAHTEEMMAAAVFAGQHRMPMLHASVTLQEQRQKGDRSGPRVFLGLCSVLVSLAVNAALAQGFREVWIGLTEEDIVPNAIFLLGDAFNVKVEAPFRDLSRQKLLQMAASRGWMLQGSWSCHTPLRESDGSTTRCGTCIGCRQPRSLEQMLRMEQQ